VADSYTSSNRFTKIEPGTRDNTWGGGLNDETIEMIDDSLDGFVTIDVSAGDITLTTNNGSADQARSRNLRIIGDLVSARTITIPDQHKWYNIEVAVSGTGSVTILNVADSTGVTVSAGSNNLSIICDGTSTRPLVSGLNPGDVLQVSNNLSDLTNTSAARDNLGLQPGSFLTQSSTSVNVNMSAVFDVIYPVGSIYTNYNDDTNPGSLMGFGTWVSVATGRVIVGAGTGVDANGVSASFTATSTGGEYEHTQTIAELAPHAHPAYQDNNGQQGGNTVGRISATDPGGAVVVSVGSTGGGDAFNIQQPYLVAHIWRRSS